MNDHLFVVETELQLLAAMAVEQQCVSAADETTYYFLTSEKLLSIAGERGVKNRFLLDRHHKGGLLGKIRFLKSNTGSVLAVARECVGEGHAFTLYVPRIDDIYNNVIAGKCRKEFGTACQVALLPDGALNIFSDKISSATKHRLRNWAWKLRLLAPGYPVLQFTGDELGADSEYIDIIYSFRGIKAGYPSEKERYINFPEQNVPAEASVSAIIIGQNFLAFRQGNHDFVDGVTVEIDNLLGKLKPDRVYYARHPRAESDEFRVESAALVSGPYLCIEEVIAALGCRYVISCSSTVLFTAKMVIPDIESYAVGAAENPAQNSRQRERLLDVMRISGVRIVSLSTGLTQENA